MSLLPSSLIRQASLFGAEEPSYDPALRGLERTLLGAGAWIDHLPEWVRGHESLLEILWTTTRWESQRRPMYDRIVDVPRLAACRVLTSTSRLSGASGLGRHAVAAFRSSSWRRAPATIEARSEVSMTRSKPRFTAPAAKAALAQCMHALMPCLWAASRMRSQVATCTGSGLSPRGAMPRAKERSEGPM